MLAVYAYVDASGNIRKAESDEFNFTGTWGSSGTYLAITKDTVNYSNSQYVAAVTNYGHNPALPSTPTNPQPWSPLVLISPATPGTNSLAQDAFNLAESAYELAVIGTNVGTNAYTLASAGSNLAWQAYLLAQSGTSGTDPTTLAIAQAAFSIAVQGTNAAQSAYTLAQVGTNVGTNALNQSSAAMTVAQSAFRISVAGTATANEALGIAVIGTNLGTLAYNTAIQAQATANEALSIAIIGTNSFSTLSGLLSAGTTYGTRINIPSGTNFVYVNGLNLPFTPTVNCTVQMPGTNSLNLWPTLVGDPTNNGFVVSLNGQTDSTGYKLHAIFRA